ncbi:MAG: protein kinase [Planctomycetota bacterium]|nr:protein kinase [Planctomycetota bacterium]
MAELIADRYEVEREIGKGGMGRIVLALDKHLNRHVAVKTMIRADNRTARSRFIEESQITGQLTHPNIVSIHELGRDPKSGHLFLAMKLIKGRDLKDIIQALNKRHAKTTELFRYRRILRLFLKVCEAMAYAHNLNVIHRDLKPANIMFGEDQEDEVLVMDWGLAKPINKDAKTKSSKQIQSVARSGILSMAREEDPDPGSNRSGELTQEGAVVGTPCYMPPEQGDNPAGVDHRADIYALGAILYEILTYKPPYRGSSFSVLNELFKRPPPLPSKAAPFRNIDPAIESIVLKAMSRDIAQRYQSALELKQDIESYLDGGAVSAYQEDAREAFLRWSRKNKKLLVTIVIAVFTVIALFAGAFYVTHQRQSEAESKRLQSFVLKQEARLGAWRSHVIRPLAKESESVNSALQQAFKFVGRSEKALTIGKLTGEHDTAQQELEKRELSLSTLKQRIQLMLGEKNGPTEIFDGLTGETEALQSLSTKSKDKAFSLIKKVDPANKDALLKDVYRPFDKLIEEIAKTRELLDRSFARALVNRFPDRLNSYLKSLKLGDEGAILGARANLRLWKFREARKIIEEAMAPARLRRVSPNIKTALIALETFLRNKPQAARLREQLTALNRAIESENKAAETGQAGVGNPGWLYMRRAQVYKRLGQFSQARADFDRAVTLNPIDSYCLMLQTRETTSYVTGGETLNSIELAVLSLSPRLGEMLAVSAILRQYQEGGLRAQSRIDKAVKQGRLPKDIARYYKLMVAINDQDNSTIRKLAKEFEKDDPENPMVNGLVAESLLYEPEASRKGVLRLRGNIKRWQKELPKKRDAIISLQAQMARETNPDRLEGLKNQLALVRREVSENPKQVEYAEGKILTLKKLATQSKQFFLDRAEKIAKDGLRRHPEDDRLNFARGEILRIRGLARDALPFLERGALASFNPTRYLKLAQCCLVLGDEESLKKGVKAIQMALQFDNIGEPNRSAILTWIKSGDPILHETFGELRMKQGLFERAILHFMRAAKFAMIPDKNQYLAKRDRYWLRAAEAHLQLKLNDEAAFILQQFAKNNTPAAAVARKMLGMK